MPVPFWEQQQVAQPPGPWGWFDAQVAPRPSPRPGLGYADALEPPPVMGPTRQELQQPFTTPIQRLLQTQQSPSMNFQGGAFGGGTAGPVITGIPTPRIQAPAPQVPLPQIFGTTGPAVAQQDILPTGPMRTLSNGMTAQSVALTPEATAMATAPGPGQTPLSDYARFHAQITGEQRPPPRVNPAVLQAFVQTQVAERGLQEAELRQRNNILDQIIAAHAINNPSATAQEMAAERARLAPGFGMPGTPDAAVAPGAPPVRALLGQLAFPRTPGMPPNAAPQRAPIDSFLQSAVNRPGFNLNENIGDVVQFMRETYGPEFDNWWQQSRFRWTNSPDMQLRDMLANAINARSPGGAPSGAWSPTLRYYGPLPLDLPARLRGNTTPLSPR
jgi:hypothetical protein